MQNILVPTDFSNNAFHALQYATELLNNKECTFFLLNLYNEKKGFRGKQIDDNLTNPSDGTKEKALTRLEDTLQKIKKEKPYPKHRYKLISEPADLARTVNRLVYKFKIDLIVMGNKGKKSSIPVYLGEQCDKSPAICEKMSGLNGPEKCRICSIKRNSFCHGL